MRRRPGSPFRFGDAAAFRAWREAKLAAYPRRAAELVVEVRDPRALRAAERTAIEERLRRANMAIYASRPRARAGKELARILGRQFGLERIDSNWLAGDDGVSRIAVREDATRGEFIPYTSRAIGWHTDGYYNPPERRIRAFILHCASSAAAGGESLLLDHELAYLALRERNPAWIRALMRPGAMTIPARADEAGVARAASSAAVFSIDARDGALHMRYTARTVSIGWARDAATAGAVACLADWLGERNPYALRLRLEAGMGVICNNVLHARTAFADAPERPRLLFRIRYLERARPRGCYQ
ncbi:MAG: TauD/TfdA family dioxygenase [Burkholderiales bacterium]|nr:TauD/TfdA family dioxygenase [Burkholderiales bacterium]